MPLALAAIYGCSLFEADEIKKGDEGQTFRLDTIETEDSTHYENPVDTDTTNTSDSTGVSDTTSNDSTNIGTLVNRSDFLLDLEIINSSIGGPFEYRLTAGIRERLGDTTITINNHPKKEKYAIFNHLFRNGKKISERTIPAEFEAEIFRKGYFKVIEEDGEIYGKASNAKINGIVWSSPLVFVSKPTDIEHFKIEGEGKYNLETYLTYSVKELGEKYLSVFKHDFSVVNGSSGKSIKNLESKLKGTWKIK